MSDCSNIPVELVLSTTDPNLYDAKNKKWLWDGQMYWAVKCLPHRQTTVSDRVIPRLPANNYLKLDKIPAVWDYCKSTKCTANSESMHVIFTFNPQSTNPNDYLQFVVDIHCHVTDFPKHDIMDNGGNKFYIDIVEVGKMTREPYVEIWIARTHQDKKLTVAALKAAHAEFKEPGDDTSSRIGLIIGILLAILIIASLTGFMLYWYKRKAGAPVITGGVEVGNIG
uniref:Uncharacterized protein n=1 Tax=Marseillevirus LCMAC202 TaxID=2506606 RepID=A0A481YXW1_9VIRU|nr:MAG: hypothetical protein LCMAC202_03300 [Marseillevirus LCMAC202]